MCNDLVDIRATLAAEKTLKEESYLRHHNKLYWNDIYILPLFFFNLKAIRDVKKFQTLNLLQLKMKQQQTKHDKFDADSVSASLDIYCLVRWLIGETLSISFSYLFTSSIMVCKTTFQQVRLVSRSWNIWLSRLCRWVKMLTLVLCLFCYSIST